MSKTLVVRPEDERPGEVYNKKGKLNKEFYEVEIKKLQIELIKLQNWVKKHQKKIIIILEGRDAAGKGGLQGAAGAGENQPGAQVAAFFDIFQIAAYPHPGIFQCLRQSLPDDVLHGG